MTFPVPKAAAETVAAFEGFRSVPYQDQGGVWTYGFGSTRDGAGLPVEHSTPPLNRVGATVLLTRDLSGAAQAVAKAVHVALNDNQAAALVSLVYNCGPGNVLSAASTLLKKINAKDFAGAADAFLAWNRCAGQVNRGLVTRRTAERKLFLTPCPAPWPPKTA